jgi:hypothetical protein
MNLSHILDTARKLGIPVVITNERGESPQVVMPFEDFASMVGVSMAVKPKNHPRISPDDSQDDEASEVLADLAIGDLERRFQEELAAAHVEEPGERPAEGLLEDQFTFEPVVDEGRGTRD